MNVIKKSKRREIRRKQMTYIETIHILSKFFAFEARKMSNLKKRQFSIQISSLVTPRCLVPTQPMKIISKVFPVSPIIYF